MNKLYLKRFAIWLSLASLYFILALLTFTNFKLFALYMSLGVITLNFCFLASVLIKE